jgi:hypothetical protein
VKSKGCSSRQDKNPTLIWQGASLVLVLVPHGRQDLGKIHYSGPVLYFMVKNVLNSQKSGFLSGIPFLYSPEYFKPPHLLAWL